VFILHVCRDRSTFLFAVEVIVSRAIVVFITRESAITFSLHNLHLLPEQIWFDAKHPWHTHRCDYEE
jgi:hypothetical protein